MTDTLRALAQTWRERQDNAARTNAVIVHGLVKLMADELTAALDAQASASASVDTANAVRTAVVMFAGYLSVCETLPPTRGEVAAWIDLAKEFIATLSTRELHGTDTFSRIPVDRATMDVLRDTEVIQLKNWDEMSDEQKATMSRENELLAAFIARCEVTE